MARKTRSFTGCTTCRARKVKCDLIRPHCQRCERAKIQCGGYDIVLGWSDPLTISPHNGALVTISLVDGRINEDPETCHNISVTTTSNGTSVSRFQRRNIELVTFPPRMRYTTYKQLCGVIEKLDRLSENETAVDNVSIGPFGIYRSGGLNLGAKRSSHEPATLTPRKRRIVESQDSESSVTKSKQKISPKKSDSRVATSNDHRIKSKPSKTVTHPPNKSTASSQKVTGSLSKSPSSKTSHDRSVATPSTTNTEPPATTTTASTLTAASTKPIHRVPQGSSIFSKTDNSYVHYNLLDSAKLTILAIKGPNYKFNEQNMFHILYPKFFPNTDSDDCQCDYRILKRFVYLNADGSIQITRLLPMVLQGLTSDLFTFIRVQYASNYWDTLVRPFIRNMVCEFICEDSIAWDQIEPRHNDDDDDDDDEYSKQELINRVKLAVIYQCISITMFQRSTSVHGNVENDDDRFQVDDFLRLSIYVRKLAVKIVNYHLDEYDTHSTQFDTWEGYDNLMMLMIILQIEVDNYFGVFENYELLYAIGDFMGRTRFKFGKGNQISILGKYLFSVFKMMSIFYESTQAVNLFNYAISQGDERENYGDLKDDYDLIGSDDDDDDEEEEEDEEDEEEDDEDIQLQSISSRRKSSDKGTKRKTSGVQIEPQALTDDISNYNPMSFTVSFNKRNDSDFEEESSSMEEPQITASRAIQPTPNRTANFRLDTCYLMYGLPQALVNLFHEIVHLTNHKNVFNRRKIMPRNFPRICAELEDRLTNFDVEVIWQLREPDGGFSSRLSEGLWYNVVSMHNAMIVYFHRLIKEVSISQYQGFIEKSLVSLDQLMRLMNSGATSEVRFNPSFWPILICGCDIDLNDDQHGARMKSMVERMWSYPQFEKYNVWRSKQIMFEVWKRRSMGEDFSVMDMVREWGIVLSLG